MKRVIGGSLFLALGGLAGVASAVGVVEIYGASPVVPGSQWQNWNLAPTANSHPYALAHYLLAGRFPPATGQMREFSTQRSTDGGALTAVCDYVLVANPAPALWWSMTAYSSGRPDQTANSVITADTAVVESDGSLRLAVTLSPASGNWIRPPATGAFTLLYTIAEPSPSQSHLSMPSFTVDRSGC